MSEWTREHDAVIARECEDVGEIFKGNQDWPLGGWCGMKHNPMDLYYVDGDEHGHAPVGVDRYSTDLVACFRAAEAWKAIDVDRRGYSTMSASSSQPTAICWTSPRCLVGEDLYQGQGKEPSQALAWALYNAVKGTK